MAPSWLRFSASLTTTNSQLCALLPDGARIAASSTLVITSSGTGSGLKRLSARAVYIASNNPISAIAKLPWPWPAGAIQISRSAPRNRTGGLLGADQLVLDCVAYHRGRRFRLELLLKVVAIDLGSLGTDTTSRGDLLAGRALTDEAQHLALAPREFYDAHAPSRGGAAWILEPCEYGRRDRGAQVAPTRGPRAQRAQPLRGG